MCWPSLEDRNSLRDQIDRIFKSELSNDKNQSLSHFFPVEVSEKTGEYLIKVMVPGVDPENIHVESCDRLITLYAETQPRELGKDESVHISDFQYGKFSRHLSFPVPLETEKIEAEYELGLLKIRVPKTEVVQRKHIEIKVNQDLEGK